ncbi:unnamed protein product [Blepharisma stoltei]|uniref:Exocyst complex component Sec3 coiled-coil domain-containing protein n=1 Tax=Blepharisma stoltei TaxID=1481888 RepID=A0AAU9JRE5_9CILI|nr:unnamed protein product [Blepharisma stoltei]
MDSELLEWLSYEELQQLASENLVESLENKLQKTEKQNIDQILQNQTQTQDLINQIDLADTYLQELQEKMEGFLKKIQETRNKTIPLEQQNMQFAIQQNNTAALIQTLSNALNKHG